ncbi:MAG: NTP pyrophosphohydrolase, partial [Rhodobacteraceae bacterium]
MSQMGCMSALLAVNISVIEAPRLRLRRLTDDDIPALVSGCSPWEVARYTAHIAHPYGEADAREFLHGAVMDRNANTRHVFGLETRIGGDLIGCIEVNMGYGGDTFGYWIGVDHWGQGYATEAALALCRFAFQNAGKDELCAAVHPDNGASARVLEKAGFVYDRTEFGLSGRCASVAARVYRLTAKDWFAREAAKPKLLVS